jgi:long-chain acyl-CoA synthetase
MTIKEMFERTVAAHGERTALRFKRDGVWHTLCYAELRRRARTVSEICAARGVEPGDRVALYRENSPEWPELYLGITAIGATAVPVDAHLREQELLHVLHDSGAVLIFASARFYPMLEPIADRLPALRNAVLLEGGSELPVESNGLACFDYARLCRESLPRTAAMDAAYDRRAPGAEDVASIIYTSGTTGRQKGAMLTHRNFTSNVESALQVLRPRLEDNFLLVLPLHHSFAFTAVFLIPLCAGCEISLVESLRTLAQNMAETRPSVLMGVPLLLEKMLSRVRAGLREQRLARGLLRCGLGRLAGRAVVRKLGGRLRLMVSGGAPCDPQLLKSWNRLGVKVVEGYGITETAPVLSFNPPRRPRPGTVGRPIPGVEIEIDQPDEHGVGEIRARGPNVMRGYCNRPEETAEVLRDGWYYTGDLGRFDRRGYLVICGRKKSLIVNREGKNIYPEEVEQHLLQSPLILECLVLGYREAGDAVGERVGVIAVPDTEAFESAGPEGTAWSDRAVAAAVRREIRERSAELAPHKRPRRVEIRFEEFEKTSTAKIKRHLYAVDTAGMGPGRRAAECGGAV